MRLVCWNWLWHSPFKKKNVCLWAAAGEGGVDNTSWLFYGQSILISNFASRSSGLFFSLFFSPINRFPLVFVSEPTFMQQKFAYNVGPVSTYSVHYYSTFSWPSPTSNLSLLISLLYTPNKVLPFFCWNLHLTLVHCHCWAYKGLFLFFLFSLFKL